jgi:hypothetical protein
LCSVLRFRAYVSMICCLNLKYELVFAIFELLLVQRHYSWRGKPGRQLCAKGQTDSVVWRSSLAAPRRVAWQGAAPWTVAWQRCGARASGAAQAAATPWRGKPVIFLRSSADNLNDCVWSRRRRHTDWRGKLRRHSEWRGKHSSSAWRGKHSSSAWCGRFCYWTCRAKFGHCLRRQREWRGRAAAPDVVARQGCGARLHGAATLCATPGAASLEQFESKFLEIHFPQQHSKLSRKSQAGCAKVTNPSK